MFITQEGCSMRLHVTALLGLVLLSSALFAQQQAVLTAVKDNTLYQTADGSKSNGAGSYFFVGRVAASGGGAIRRGLVKFDLSSIPAGATVTSVSLRLNMSKTTSGAQTVILKRLTADWGEGTSNADANEGSGATSTTGDATWLHRFHATSTWTVPGGESNVAAPTSASLSVGAVGAYTFASTAQLVADVQGWLANPSTNFGWLLAGNEESSGTSKRFDARENATTTNRPQLTVQYTTSTSVEEGTVIPDRVVLEGNYPNPFNPSTQIRFSLPADQPAQLSVFNLLGVKVATLVDGALTAGSHTVAWDATGMPSGLYFARLESGGVSSMKRMVLTK
jgi:hypothetical protein